MGVAAAGACGDRGRHRAHPHPGAARLRRRASAPRPSDAAGAAASRDGQPVDGPQRPSRTAAEHRRVRHTRSELSKGTPSFFLGWVRAVTRLPGRDDRAGRRVARALAPCPRPTCASRCPTPVRCRRATEPARPTTSSPSTSAPGYNGPLIVTGDDRRQHRPARSHGRPQAARSRRSPASPPSRSRPRTRRPTPGSSRSSRAAAPTRQATEDLVARDPRHCTPTSRTSTASTSQVTGITAIGIDISDRLGGALLPFGLARGRPLVRAADDGVPLDRGCRSRRRSATCCRSARRSASWRSSSSTAGSRACSRREDRAGDQLHADHADGRAVRARDGLRGVPRLADARGLRARRRRAAMPSRPASCARRRSSPPPP